MKVKKITTHHIILFFLFVLFGTHFLYAQTFPCDGKLYFFRDNGTSNKTLSYVDNYTTPNPYVADVCTMQTTTHNALGANTKDGYLYFLDNSNYTLNRLDANCNITPVCTLAVASAQGCFDNLGRYWINSTSGFQAIDISTCTVVKGPYSYITVPGSADISYSVADCKFYAASDTVTYGIDTNGVVVDTFNIGFGAWGIGGNAIGIDGKLYGMRNDPLNGNLYSVDLTTAVSDSLFNFPVGAPNGNADMASFVCDVVDAKFIVTPDSGCISQTVQFSDVSTGFPDLWLWDFGDPASGTADTSSFKDPTHTYSSIGTYIVTLVVSSASSGCKSGGQDTVTFTMVVTGTVPTAAITGLTTICSGDSITLTASGGFNFLWNTGSTDTSLTVSPQNDTVYSVIVYNGSCSDTATVNITVNPIPTATITGADTICNGTDLTLNASGGTNFLWNTNDTTASITVSPSLNTNYSVIVSNGNCFDQDSILLIVNPSPVASAGTDVTITKGSNTTLIANGGGTYSWSPSTGLNCTDCQITIAKPETTTTYYLNVTDANGCTNIDSVTVYVVDETVCGEFFIPTAFSPNNDEQNEMFYVRGNCIKDFSLVVFDRWGEKVFETTDMGKGWNGKYGDKNLNTSIFVYYVNATLSNGDQISKKGTITLIR